MSYPVVEVENKIVALAELEKSPHQGEENIYWIKFISVDPEYQRQGYASKIAEEIFKYARDKGITLQSSSCTEVGFEKLKDKLNELAKKYSVKFIDADKGL